MVCLSVQKGMCIRPHTPKNVLSMIFVCENALDRHDTASSSSLPSSLHSKSLDSVPPLLECVLVKSFTLLVADRAKVCREKVQVKMQENGFLATSGSPSPYTLQANFQLPF